MTDTNQQLSDDEAERAREELRAATELLRAALPRVALTRTYFAAFHAIRALLYSRGLEPRTHDGTLHLFNLGFVRTGAYAPADGRLLARLQKYREEADCGSGFVADAAFVGEELAAAQELVTRVLADRTPPPSG